ncbi:hypothetical protein H4R34_001153 [Dimargaris verticillata]|uniref:Uncharacterized protein n=1 Tax=Dimargaris verticillata TaxID=2761393 RepID=A0A9W8BBA9_9FUNG|nr:hypothetical protein H4R34_001153 [Dimargaris verticillata]
MDKSDHFTGPSIMTSEELGQPQKQPYGSETDETELTPDNEGLPGPGIRGLTSESGDAVAKLEQAILDSSLSEVKKSEFLQLVAQIKDSPSNSASFDHEQLSPAPSNEPNAGSEKDATDPKYQLISMALSAMMGSSNQSSQAPGSGGSGGTAQLIQSILSQFAKPPAPGASS